MRIRLIILTFILLKFGLINAQSTLSSPSNNNVALPNFTPPSPKSFEYTKYGDIPVNEFSGLINYNIPLYEYKAGNLTLPISLDYASCGVKVDQSNTWTGINWILRTGGVISRTINDLADEMYGQMYRINLNSMPLNSGADGSPQANYFVNIIENNMYDSEADIFNFNFNGYSGSFFLDNNLEPTLVKNDSELKITTVGSLQASQEFIITTPDGSKYFFGGINAIETEAGTSANPCSSCGRATSYYLTKIIHPINGTILFEYETMSTSNSIARSRNYGVLTFSSQTSSSNVCGGAPPPPENTNEILITSKQANSRFLKKIYSPDNSTYIDFIATNKNLGNSFKILNKIEVRDSTNLIKEFDFEYLGTNQNSSSTKRFFLTKLIFNKNLCLTNNLLNKLEEYKMEYNEPEELPDRFSYAQDYYGYYNGVLNNISSLPQLNINYFNIANYNYLAADRKPNFQFAKKGTLKKIIFPTKGFTEFEYEGIPVKEKVYTKYEGRASLSTTGANLDNSYVPRYDTDLETSFNLDPIIEDQLVFIKINLSSDELCALPNHNLKTKLIIEDLTTSGSQPTVFQQQIGYLGGSESIPFNFQKDINYKVSVEFFNTTSNCLSSPLNISFEFELFTSYKITDGKGVRIKRIIDKPDNNSSTNIKRYYYIPYNKVSTYLYPENVSYASIPRLISYGMLNYRGKHLDGEGPEESWNCVFNWWSDQAYYSYINSNAVQNCFNATDGDVYPFVTISYGGDNFENGGTQKIFHKIVSEYGSDLNSLSTPQYPTGILQNRFNNKLNNEKVLSGNLIQQIDFQKRGGFFYKKKQREYIYEDCTQSPNKSYINIIGKKVFDVMEFYNGIDDPLSISSNYYIKLFLTKSFNAKLNSIQESDYVGECLMPNYDFTNTNMLESDISIDLSQYQDPSNTEKIVTTQTYEYGSLRGLPTLTTTTTSINDKILRTQNHYANELNSLTGLTNDEQGALSNLVNENRIATPIQVEQYQNDELLATQKTIYKEHANHLSLPERIQTSKGANPLEDRVIFEEYDAKGNPTVVLLKDGTKTKYFYNAINQVVLKVENYTSALNIPDVPDLSDACGFINLYPSAMMSVYNYDPITNQIVNIVASNCQTTTYVYDNLHQLKLIKDNDDNIIQEFDHNYKH